MTLYDNFFDDMFKDEFFRGYDKSFNIDILKKEDGYDLIAELPGIKKDELNVSVDKDILTIKVIKKENKEENNYNYIHKEISEKELERSIRIPNIDTSSISAKLEDGILKINLKNKELQDKKTIAIE
ncbi:MAG: Hsp20/alpha crystallin family protein [Tissierellia bacterium]|nr:Hsp20/alpha crystallin family protein [Tissierellia bacterium]